MRQGFVEDVAVAGGEGDAAEGRESRGDVSGSDFAEEFAVVDPETRKNDRDVLVVEIGSFMTGAIGTRFAGGSAVGEPIRFGGDE